HEDANIIFGAVLDEEMQDRVKVTVIATGFKKEALNAHPGLEAPARAPLTFGRSTAPGNGGLGGAVGSGSSRAPEDLDVPAFLRRKAEPGGR
ncbi:MAG: cell division protein FtsZ, partial [Acidobacteria bacterium]|nr:cell division protein FtsZ [Acidobacteriota bacterium]